MSWLVGWMSGRGEWIPFFDASLPNHVHDWLFPRRPTPLHSTDRRDRRGPIRTCLDDVGYKSTNVTSVPNVTSSRPKRSWTVTT